LVPTVVLCRQGSFPLAALLGELYLDTTFHIGDLLGIVVILKSSAYFFDDAVDDQ
jgi:hypothetical protein